MVDKRSTRKAVNNFRNIKFPGTKNNIAIDPQHFMVKKGEKVSEIHFPGTETRLGKSPKGFDQRKKARNRLSEFDLGDPIV